MSVTKANLYKTETRDANQYTLQELAKLYESDPTTVRGLLLEGGIKPTAVWDRRGRGRKPELYTDLMNNKFEDILSNASGKHKRKRIAGKAITSGARVSPRTQGIILEAQIRLALHLLTCEKTGAELYEYIESYHANATDALTRLRQNIAEGKAVEVESIDEVTIDASVNPLRTLSFGNDGDSDNEVSDAQTAAEVRFLLSVMSDPNSLEGSPRILVIDDSAGNDEVDDVKDDESEDADDCVGDQIVFDASSFEDEDDEVEVYVF